jgi:hypothetical protein
MTHYRAMAEELLKIAADDKKEKPSPLGTGARMLGATALGAGLGTGAGYGIGMLADRLSKQHAGHPLPMKYVVPAGTFLGGMSGLLLEHVRRKNLEDTRRAIEGQ